jgi:FKBP-type peptidyl-prolyl cis-trans isomerase FklB
MNANRKAKTEKLIKAGRDFLAENGKKAGIITTPSGLQYEVLKKGEGEVPQKTDKVKCHYEGRLIDGTVFDSSIKRGEPAVFGLNQVIKGWTEALSLMPVGSKWRLYIPQELGYGERQAGQIPPYSTLIFDVELLSIEK